MRIVSEPFKIESNDLNNFIKSSFFIGFKGFIVLTLLCFAGLFGFCIWGLFSFGNLDLFKAWAPLLLIIPLWPILLFRFVKKNILASIQFKDMNQEAIFEINDIGFQLKIGDKVVEKSFKELSGITIGDNFILIWLSPTSNLIIPSSAMNLVDFTNAKKLFKNEKINSA
jgi:hypothetical protein